jgi:hypothetical protein
MAVMLCVKCCCVVQYSEVQVSARHVGIDYDMEFKTKDYL